MIGSLKSLIQSGLRERRAWGSSRSLGTQALGYWLESTVCSIRTPTPSLQLSTTSTPSFYPGFRSCQPSPLKRWWPQLCGPELWSTLRALWEPTRRQKNQEWEERVHETGASVDDVAELEKILKRAIILRDIAGEDIYNSGKYQRGGNGVRGIVELIYHNGHAWSKDLHFLQSREVHIYEGDVWHAIREFTQGEPLAVWLLGGQDRQLSVDQFMLQDGRTYRTREAHERLKAICAKLGNPELAEWAFGENHAASIMAKERNGWKPTPAKLLPDIEKACVEHGHGGLWNSIGYNTREVTSIDMKACYPASFQGMGEAKPYFDRFGHPTHRMTRVAINGPLPNRFTNGSLRLPAIRSSLPGLEGISPKAVGPWHSSLPSWQSLACWGLSKSGRRSSPSRSRLRFGPGLLCHRQIHAGQQGRWKKAHKEVGDRPRRARLPCPEHPPLGHFGRSTNEVRAWSHPHLLRWLSTTVCPFEDLDAGLRPHQPPLYAFKVWTQRGRPSGSRFHLCKENSALQARGGQGLQASRGAPRRELPHLSHLPWQDNP